MGRKRKESSEPMTHEISSPQSAVNIEPVTPHSNRRPTAKATKGKEVSLHDAGLHDELPPLPVSVGTSRRRGKAAKQAPAKQEDVPTEHQSASAGLLKTSKGKGSKRSAADSSPQPTEAGPGVTTPSTDLKKHRTPAKHGKASTQAEQHVHSAAEEAAACERSDHQVLVEIQPGTGEDNTAPVTPAKKVAKPKRKSKATIGQEAAMALASQGDVEPQFLLYGEYPHARAFSLVGSQGAVDVSMPGAQGTLGDGSQAYVAVVASQAGHLAPAPSQGAASQLEALQESQTSMMYLASQPVQGGTQDTCGGYVPHRFTQTHMSVVVTYHAEDFRSLQQQSPAPPLDSQEIRADSIQITGTTPAAAVDADTGMPSSIVDTVISKAEAAADADAIAGNSAMQTSSANMDVRNSAGKVGKPTSNDNDSAGDDADVTAAEARHSVEYDTEELPQDIKSIVLEGGLADRIKSRSQRFSRSKSAGRPAGSDGSSKEGGQAADKKLSPAPSRRLVGDDQLDLKLVEDIQPIGISMALCEVPPDDPGFNQQLREKPWPKVVPNLGYACLCATLRAYDVYCSRDCIQKTFIEKGLPAISQLALANARDLLALIRWNARHGIQLFRLSSGILPWMSKYKVEELPDYEAIKEALAAAGAAARACGQRLTFHPSEFVKIAGPDDRDHWTEQSILELEQHSKIFDLMGYEPSPWNKLNIHVGAVYGDKETTLKRFAKVVNERLSPNCKARLCVENDDKASMYSVKELLALHEMCGVPITFDFHHHKFCTGGWTELQAFQAAMSTWPKGIRPVVHWSEAANDSRAQAHSDYVYGPIYLHGYESDVDVMIESKAKELALLKYRELHIRKISEQCTAGVQPEGPAFPQMNKPKPAKPQRKDEGPNDWFALAGVS